MGSAWGSFLAQPTLLAQCFAGGLKRNQVLSDDHLSPYSTRLNFALATDDLLVFARGNQRAAHHRVACVDAAVTKAGIVPHVGKNVDESASGTAIGVDLDDGVFLAPHTNKLFSLIIGLAYFLGERPLATKKHVQAIMGHLCWFALLNRHTFSCFDEIYDAIGSLSEIEMKLPDCVFREVALFVSLFPWLEADLTRPWQQHLVASDASGSFGFGVAVAPLPEHKVRDIGRHATRPGTFVRLDRSSGYVDDEAPRVRQGKPLQLRISKAAFGTVVSSRYRFKAHSGMLEAHAVTLSLRWILRSVRRHSRRTVLLVDATAVCGALAKGRSSSPTLKREFM